MISGPLASEVALVDEEDVEDVEGEVVVSTSVVVVEVVLTPTFVVVASLVVDWVVVASSLVVA